MVSEVTGFFWNPPSPAGFNPQTCSGFRLDVPPDDRGGPCLCGADRPDKGLFFRQFFSSKELRHLKHFKALFSRAVKGLSGHRTNVLDIAYGPKSKG